MGAVA